MPHTDNISVRSAAGSISRIAIGPLSDNLAAFTHDKRRIIFITDANVHLSNRELIDAHDHIVIGQGETAKTLRSLEDVVRRLLEMDADRSSFLIGMGGGVVTDITGLTASVYMRGIGFGFIPTTLLGQVDAAIGGKNGVNVDGYKNIIGTFNQPEFVICDPSLLKTLSEREFRGGLAEILKAGIIADPELFALLESNSPSGIRDDEELLSRIIRRAACVKAAIVSRDELEKDERRKLNLGHTFAHSMEKLQPTFTHGEAVAAGIVTISKAAVKLGKLSDADYCRIHNAVASLGLPTEYPVETRKLIAPMKFDKKREGGSVYVVFPRTIGETEVSRIEVDQLNSLFP